MKGADGGMYHDQYLFGSFYLVFINKVGMQLLRRFSTFHREWGVGDGPLVLVAALLDVLACVKAVTIRRCARLNFTH